MTISTRASSLSLLVGLAAMGLAGTGCPGDDTTGTGTDSATGTSTGPSTADSTDGPTTVAMGTTMSTSESGTTTITPPEDTTATDGETTATTGEPPLECPYDEVDGTPSFALQMVGQGFNRPILALGHPTEPDRLFVVEQ